MLSSYQYLVEISTILSLDWSAYGALSFTLSELRFHNATTASSDGIDINNNPIVACLHVLLNNSGIQQVFSLNMLDNQILLTPHLTLPLHILRHTSRNKDLVPILICHPPAPHIPLPLPVIPNFNSCHSLMLQIHICKLHKCVAKRRMEVVRAPLRWHCRLMTSVGGEETGEEAGYDGLHGWH